MQNPSLRAAVEARENSMRKKPRDKPHNDDEGLATIQKMAWNAHDQIFGMAADIGQAKGKNPAP